MRLKKGTKSFGIHSDRVRHSGLKYIRGKYGNNSDQHKDYKERKDAIDMVSELGHFTPTPERNLNDSKSTSLQGSYKRDLKYRNSIEKAKNVLKKQEYGDEFTEKLINKYLKDNKNANKKLAKYKDGTRSVTPKFIKMMKESGIPGTVTTEGKPSKIDLIPSTDNPKSFKINIDPKGSDLEAPHEYQHLRNSLDGSNSGFVDNSYNFKNAGVAKFNKVFQNSSDHVLDYKNNTLEEEWDANRARTMLPYIHSKDRFGTKSDLSKSYNEAVASQNTYNSRIGLVGNQPQSLRSHMDKNTMDKMLENMKSKGLRYVTPDKDKVKITGHINL